MLTPVSYLHPLRGAFWPPIGRLPGRQLEESPEGTSFVPIGIPAVKGKLGLS